ncbi:MAG: hypothetical protein NNA22_06470 [Nitrospira sp.]|nr:hypothetical protein [Nitrospira sp.]
MSKSSLSTLKIAVPWSLSHYIPLNGFHPLYRALFDFAPEGFRLNAWDNVKLHRRFTSDASPKASVLALATRQPLHNQDGTVSKTRQEYQEYWGRTNCLLTAILPGDMEFLHTAPFPSLTRPFVFHCEMFHPVFFPFAHQGTGWRRDIQNLREYYRSLFAHPLCLGIWSHIPETLDSFRTFFSDPIINRKLFLSRIGLSPHAVVSVGTIQKPPLSTPRFLFMNSAHQHPDNFFKRGGHLVLRFWEAFLASGRKGQLILRCTKPDREKLVDHGVDTSLLVREEGKSVIWVEEYLDQPMLNELLAWVHFFLLPSFSLHSASILHALALGAVPVVTDTVGTNVYVKDGERGIVLEGMRAAIWRREPVTGVLVDQYNWMPELEELLVTQMVCRIGKLLDDEGAYKTMSDAALASVSGEFSGQSFSASFWRQVADLYHEHTGANHREPKEGKGVGVEDCLLDRRPAEWGKIFERSPQPVPWIKAGRSVVWELGGRFVQTAEAPANVVQGFSALNDYGESVRFAYSLEELSGQYLHGAIQCDPSRRRAKIMELSNRLKEGVARLLRPYPLLYRLTSRGWRWFRRVAEIYWRRDELPTSNIELVREGVGGYNVIRCDDRYYAILQSEGEFFLSKVEDGGYSKCFIADSAEKVIAEIIADQHSHMIHAGES